MPDDVPQKLPEKSANRGALILMGGTLGSRITGLVRNSLLTQLFPAGISDAFVTAFKVPNLFRELLAEGALTNSFVPAFARLGREEGSKLSAALLGVLLIVNGLLLGGAWFLAPWIASLLIGDPTLVDVELTVQLIRIVFPFLLTISLSALAMGLLNASEQFLAPAWAPVALNVVTITLMAIFPGNAVMLAVAHVLGGLFQLLVQVPSLIRLQLLPRGIRLWHPALAGVLLLMVPFAVTSGGRQVLNLVASNVITRIDSGAQTAFYNADLFLSLALGLFSISPALAYYSRLSRLAADAPKRVAGTLLDGLRLITFLTVPAGVALFLLAGPAVEVVFNWRSLFEGSVADPRLPLTILATAPLGFAVFPMGLNNLLIRTFYIRNEVRIPVVITLVTLALQGTLYVVLSQQFGIAGVAWAAAIAPVLQLVVLLVLVSRREQFGLAQLLNGAGRVWLAAGVAGAAVWAAQQLFTMPVGWWWQVTWLLLALAGFGVIYVGMSVLLKVPGLEAVTNRLRRR